jgi:hypothetical protein
MVPRHGCIGTLVWEGGAWVRTEATRMGAALGSGYSRLVLELGLALRGYVPPHWSVDAAWTALDPGRGDGGEG